jgi:pilus assembly protein Flp/PilA
MTSGPLSLGVVCRRSSLMKPMAVALLTRIANLRLRHAEDGQDLLEYGLLAALIAIVAIGAVTSVGNAIHSVFWQTIASSF